MNANREEEQTILRRFFIKQVTGQIAEIQGSDAKHIINVLRMKPGDFITLFNGTGTEYVADIKKVLPKSVQLQIKSVYKSKSDSFVKISLAQGFLKDKKMDMLVRQVTELGICEWIPFFADRSIPRPDKNRVCARVKRWEKIAIEAMKQCGQSHITQINNPVGFKHILDMAGMCDLKIIFWENNKEPLNCKILENTDKPFKTIFAIIGPEGGLTKNEVELAVSHGFIIAGLGPRILRAETATLAACTLMQYLFGDIGH